MTSDAWPRPLANVADDIILTKLIANTFKAISHVTLYTDYTDFVILSTLFLLYTLGCIAAGYGRDGNQNACNGCL